MPLVKAWDDITKHNTTDFPDEGHKTWKSMFFDVPTETSKDGPVAFLFASKGRPIVTHFHEVDEFQIVLEGSGTMGRHAVGYGTVHFANGFTPYGPLRGGDERLGFLTLRAHKDPNGIQKLPGARARLDSIADRKPWQATAMPDLNLVPGETGVAIKAMDNLKNDRGLAACTMALKAGAKAFAPDASKGDGQYIVVLKGSIRYEGKIKKSPTVIFVGNDEGPFQLEAGDAGCHAVALTLPVPGSHAPKLDRPKSEGLKTHQCLLCAHVYDETQGEPSAGIAPGTRWADVPQDYKCPDCEATKADFQMIEF